MIRVAKAPLDADLELFTRWLSSRGVPHRVIEENGEQVIMMPDDQIQSQLQEALRRFLEEPEFRERLARDAAQPRTTSKPGMASLYPRASLRQAPVIYLFMFVSLIVAWLTGFGEGGKLLRFLLILNPLDLDVNLNTISGRLQGLMLTIESGQIWRLLSPDFLHFNILHITFNCLMLWILGGQLEIRKGSAAFLAMAVFVSVISNVAQLIDSGYLFGGLSGVVYGLVGYLWVWKRVSPDIFFPDALLKFSLVWLILGYTPLTEWIGLGQMANSAHLYGLLSGLLWGWITTGIRTKKSPDSTS